MRPRFLPVAVHRRGGPTAVAAVLALGGCAGLGALANLQPPRFEAAPGRQAEMRLVLPSPTQPMGGAAVRLWARVENPNTIGLNLAGVDGRLFLENTEAALVDFPLGLPLPAQGDTIIPFDIALDFADLEGLADVALRAVSGSALAYRLDGRVRVDAGPLGQPVFGPSTLLTGNVTVRR